MKHWKLKWPHNNDADNDDQHEENDDGDDKADDPDTVWKRNRYLYWQISVICLSEPVKYGKLMQPHKNDADDDDEHEHNDNKYYHNDGDNDHGPDTGCGREI